MRPQMASEGKGHKRECDLNFTFSEVTDQLGLAVLSVIPGNPLLWIFLM